MKSNRLDRTKYLWLFAMVLSLALVLGLPSSSYGATEEEGDSNVTVEAAGQILLPGDDSEQGAQGNENAGDTEEVIDSDVPAEKETEDVSGEADGTPNGEVPGDTGNAEQTPADAVNTTPEAEMPTAQTPDATNSEQPAADKEAAEPAEEKIAAPAAATTKSTTKESDSTQDKKTGKTGFFKENGKKYYYLNGKKKTGWINVGNKWYGADKNGVIYVNRFVKSLKTGHYYFAGADGAFKVGVFKAPNGNLYFGARKSIDGRPAGEVQKYLIKDGKNTYYGRGNASGALLTNQFLKIKGKYYRFAGNGNMVKGKTIKVGMVPYTFYKGGSLKVEKGMKKIGNRKYYKYNNGLAAVNKWVTYKGNRYYAGKNGVMLGSWQKYNGNKYYFDPKSYALQRNKFIVKGTSVSYVNKYGTLQKTPFYYNGQKVTPTKKYYGIPYNVYKALTSPIETHILIDLSDQRLTYYKNGGVFVHTAITTGADNSPTPTGTYYILGKKTNTTLVGPDYRSPVSYWMNFIGNMYGIHDASWRSSFGGQDYHWSGSHGCVNVPYSAVQKIYNNAPVGTKIVIRK